MGGQLGSFDGALVSDSLSLRAEGRNHSAILEETLDLWWEHTFACAGEGDFVDLPQFKYPTSEVFSNQKEC